MKLKNLLALAAVALSLNANAQEDVTSTYLTNANLTSLEGWTIDKEGFGGNGYTAWRTDSDVPVIEFYHTWSPNAGGAIGNTKNFEFSQTVTLPAGNYRIAVNAFYREGNGTGTNNKAYIFAGDKQQNVVGLSSAGVGMYSGENDLLKAANAFSRGDFSNEFDFTVETEQEITLGFKGYIDTYCSWCILGPVRLLKYSLDAYLADYQAKFDAANAIKDKKMGKNAKDALIAAMVDKSTLTTVAAIQEATQNLNMAINDANNGIVEYEGYKVMYDKVMALEEHGFAKFNEIDPNFLSHYATGEIVAEDLIPYEQAYNEGVWAQKPYEGMDMTYYIVNPEINGADGWTTEKTEGGNGPLLNGESFEYWSYTLGKGGFNYYQDITGLPNGMYTVSARLMNDQAESAEAFKPGAGVYAETGGTMVCATADYADGAGLAAMRNCVTEKIMVSDGKLRIGVKNINADNSMPARWFVADDFKLTYQGIDLTKLQQELTYRIGVAKEMKDADMNKDVADELWNVADNAENCPQTQEALTNAIATIGEAIEEANASIEVYKKIVAVNEKAAKLKGDDATAAYADVLATYTNKTATEVAPFEAAYLAAAKVAGPGSDITGIAPTTWVGQSGIVAAQYCPDMPGAPERYQAGAFTGDVMTMTLEGLQKGTYIVVLKGGASYTSGRGFDGAIGQNHAYFFANDALQSLEVYDRTVIAEGDVETAELTCGVDEDGKLRIGIENKTIGANWFVINLASITYVSTDLPPVDVDLAVTDAKYATFIAPFDAELPEGVKAYTVDGIGEHNELVMTEATIKANTPVILYSENAVETTISGVSKAEAATYTVGLLTGVYAPVAITDGYVLQNGEKGVEFYRVSVDNEITVPANKAYLTTDSYAKVLSFPAVATAINALTTGGVEAIYNMNGVKQNKLQKGMNIIMVNGQAQKVLVK